VVPVFAQKLLDLGADPGLGPFDSLQQMLRAGSSLCMRKAATAARCCTLRAM